MFSGILRDKTMESKLVPYSTEPRKWSINLRKSILEVSFIFLPQLKNLGIVYYRKPVLCCLPVISTTGQSSPGTRQRWPVKRYTLYTFLNKTNLSPLTFDTRGFLGKGQGEGINSTLLFPFQFKRKVKKHFFMVISIFQGKFLSGGWVHYLPN